MAKKIQLTIDEPCHEDWDQMSPADKGRFCGSCQKQVVDFSDMSDREIAQFFKKPSTGSVCGRFMQDQLDRDIAIPKKRIPWIKYFFQFALPAFLLSLKANAQQVRMGKPAIRTTVVAQPEQIVKGEIAPRIVADTVKKEPAVKTIPGLHSITPAIIVPPTVKAGDLTNLSTCTTITMGMIFIDKKKIDHQNPVTEIKGRVIDENGGPVPYASVMIEGSDKGTEANEDGYFSLKPSKDWNEMEVVVSSTGFNDKKTKINKREWKEEEMVIQLQSKSVLNGVVVTSGYFRVRVDMMVGAISVKRTRVTAVEKKVEKPLPEPALQIYPNPVVSGSTLNIGCRKMDDGYYSLQLINQAGQIIMQKEIWIDDKAVVLNIDMPSTAAGAYFLRLTNKKSGKNFTEKIIVQ